MNKIVKKLWREEDKLMSEWYLRKIGFFIVLLNHCEKTKKSREQSLRNLEKS